jgi:hypothetical protein
LAASVQERANTKKLTVLLSFESSCALHSHFLCLQPIGTRKCLVFGSALYHRGVVVSSQLPSFDLKLVTLFAQLHGLFLRNTGTQ